MSKLKKIRNHFEVKPGYYEILNRYKSSFKFLKPSKPSEF